MTSGRHAQRLPKTAVLDESVAYMQDEAPYPQSMCGGAFQEFRTQLDQAASDVAMVYGEYVATVAISERIRLGEEGVKY